MPVCPICSALTWVRMWKENLEAKLNGLRHSFSDAPCSLAQRKNPRILLCLPVFATHRHAKIATRAGLCADLAFETKPTKNALFALAWSQTCDGARPICATGMRHEKPLALHQQQRGGTLEFVPTLSIDPQKRALFRINKRYKKLVGAVFANQLFVKIHSQEHHSLLNAPHS